MANVINYKDIVDAVNEKFESYPSHSFRSVDRVEWVDEEGHLAQSDVGNSVSVFVESKVEDEEYASYNVGLLTLNVQFALDALHNNYLSVLGHCEQAVLSLEGVSQNNLKIEKVSPYYSCEIEGDLVRVEFSDVQFTSPNQ